MKVAAAVLLFKTHKGHKGIQCGQSGQPSGENCAGSSRSIALLKRQNETQTKFSAQGQLKKHNPHFSFFRPCQWIWWKPTMMVPTKAGQTQWPGSAHGAFAQPPPKRPPVPERRKPTQLLSISSHQLEHSKENEGSQSGHVTRRIPQKIVY